MAHKGSWVKFRKPMRSYPKTPQQKKVKVGGQLIRLICKGKKGKEFLQCRRIVLRCAFDDGKCNDDLLEKKKAIIKKIEKI